STLDEHAYSPSNATVRLLPWLNMIAIQRPPATSTYSTLDPPTYPTCLVRSYSTTWLADIPTVHKRGCIPPPGRVRRCHVDRCYDRALDTF
ncbi:hypothetical protein FRC07_007459, partial [Ceratobasidium sp. 392]